ncbi:hypothetical protein PYCCODRAFT_1475124 [Trametes coccinea BRFM310]|uniref:F-box domain-containing protein n=1 Tax=Trametes coccinea (strain BRFM310) TaxID=1353009 RepID=A0A1Y2IWW2_TRAC3|nr:hypothetical protein PYCCODRAFT_1475124 [Trametes coccinea BRFM310]
MIAPTSAMSFLQSVDLLQSAWSQNVHRVRREELFIADTKIAEVALQLRRRMNALLPIHSLLSEDILQIIFEYVVFSARHEPILCDVNGVRTSTGGSLRDLIAVTHVCHLWRDLAISRPAFWTHIDDRNGDSLSAVLERSGDLSLSLCCGPRGIADRMAKLLRQSERRLHRLDLYLAIHKKAVPLSLIKNYAQTLECLTVKGYAAMPSRFPNAAYPCLKALSLSPSLVLRPQALDLPQLTHLHLTGNRLNISRVQYQVPLWQLLSRTPVLEHLQLVEFDVQTVPRHSAESPIIVLPRLRSLTCLGSDLRVGLLILEVLEFPCDTIVRLADMEYPNADDAFPSSVASRSFMESFERMEFEADEEILHWHLVFEGTHSGLLLDVSHHMPDIFRNHSGPPKWFREGLLAHVALQHIRELHVSGRDPDFVVSLMHRMPQLRTLRILERAKPHEWPANHILLAALCPAIAHTDGTVLCPEMEALSIQAPSIAVLDLAPSIIAMLQARISANHPISHVAICTDFLDSSWEEEGEQDTVLGTCNSIGRLVPTLEVVEDGRLCEMTDPDVVQGIWKVDGAEKFWSTEFGPW